MDNHVVVNSHTHTHSTWVAATHAAGSAGRPGSVAMRGGITNAAPQLAAFKRTRSVPLRRGSLSI